MNHIHIDKSCNSVLLERLRYSEAINEGNITINKLYSLLRVRDTCTYKYMDDNNVEVLVNLNMLNAAIHYGYWKLIDSD